MVRKETNERNKVEISNYLNSVKLKIENMTNKNNEYNKTKQ